MSEETLNIALLSILFIAGTVVVVYPFVRFQPLREFSRNAFGGFLTVVTWPVRRLVWPVLVWIGLTPWRILVFLGTLPLRMVGSLFRALAHWVSNMRGERRRLIREISQLTSETGETEAQISVALGKAHLEKGSYLYLPTNLLLECEERAGELSSLRTGLSKTTFAKPVSEESWYREQDETDPPDRPTVVGLRFWLWFVYAFYWVDYQVGILLWQRIVAPIIRAVVMPIRSLRPAYKRLSNWSLRRLHVNWVSLRDEQNELLDEVESLPQAFKENEMKAIEEEKQMSLYKSSEERNRRINRARLSLEMAEGHLVQLKELSKSKKGEGHPMRGSRVLKVEDAMSLWEGEVKKLGKLKVLPEEVDNFISEANYLIKVISSAPAYYQKVVRAEKKAAGAENLHNLLTKRFPKLEVPKRELETLEELLARTPELWLEADWERLTLAVREVTDTVESYVRIITGFLRVNELEIDEELAEVLGLVEPDFQRIASDGRDHSIEVTGLGTRVDPSLAEAWGRTWSPKDGEEGNGLSDFTEKNVLGQPRRRREESKKQGRK